MSLKKVALTAIALLLAVTGFSQNNQNGTLVTAPIRPFAVQDTFPTAWANEIRGGPFTYSTISELSNIPTSRLVVGSIGYVSGENKYYRLTSVSPITWSDFDTVSRSSLGFSATLDPLWTASNSSSARTALGLSTNLETFWTATNAADARAALQITNTGGSGTNSGTVTSVALALPGIFSVIGSPVTNSGTFNVSLASQTQRSFLASPVSAPGTPTFRTITTNDIPTLNQNTTGTASNVTGVVAISNGGTGGTNVENARGNLGFNSNLNNLWTASGTSNARAAIDAARLSMNVVGPFESVNNFFNPANTTLQNETLIRVGVAEQVNQSAQFGYRVIGTDSNGVVGRAVFSVYGFDALMQVGSGAQSGTNYETEVFAGGGTNNKVMTLIKNITGHMEMDRPISFSTATHAANTRTNLGFNSSLNAFWTATNTDSAIAALGIGASGTSTVTRASLGFNASLDSLWTATNAEAARTALQISNIATNVTRSSLGFSTNLDSLWTATTSGGARTAIGFSAGMEPVWSASDPAIFRTNIGLGASWLTNSTAAGFRAALQLGDEQVAYFNEVAVGRAVDNYTVRGITAQTQQNFGIAFAKTGANFLEFSNNAGSGVINIVGANGGIIATSATTRANIRTNLDLGWSGLTNTSTSSFRGALGFNSALDSLWTASNRSNAINSLFSSSGITTINSGKTQIRSADTGSDLIELSNSASGASGNIILGSTDAHLGGYTGQPKGSWGIGNQTFSVKYGTNNNEWGYPVLIVPDERRMTSANGFTVNEIRQKLGFVPQLEPLWLAETAVQARDALGITATGSTNTRESLGFSTNLDTFWTATNFADARAALGIDTNTLTTRESLGLATNSSVQFSNLFLSQPPSSVSYTLSLGSPNTGFRGIGGGTNDWLFTIGGTEYIGLYSGSVTLGNAGLQTRLMSPMTFFYGATAGGVTNTGYIAFSGTAPQTGAAISRTNLGLPWSGLTNNSAQNFRTALGFNANLSGLWTAANQDQAQWAIRATPNRNNYIFTADGNDAPYTDQNNPYIHTVTVSSLPQKLYISGEYTAGQEFVEIQLPDDGDLLDAVTDLTISDFSLIVQVQPPRNEVDASISFRVRKGDGQLLTGWLTGISEDNYNPIYRFYWNGWPTSWGWYGPGSVGHNVLFATSQAIARQSLGMTLPALTNFSVPNFVRDIGLGVTNIPTFKGLTISNTNGYDNLFRIFGPFGTDFQIRLTDESLENNSYPAPRGSIGVDWSATNNFKVKYGDGDDQWGAVLYLDRLGDGGIARTNLGLGAPWLTNTNQLNFADAANIVPQDTYSSTSVGGGNGPNPIYPVTNNIAAQRRLRYTINAYPGWIGTNTSGQNVFSSNNNSVRLVMPRSLDGSKRGDIFILTPQITAVGTNNTITVSRYGHTFSTNYQTNFVDIAVFSNTTANVGFINHDGFNWRRMSAADLGLPSAVEWVTPPAATNSVGTPGQAAYSDNYLYICISNNTWRRATLATW